MEKKCVWDYFYKPAGTPEIDMQIRTHVHVKCWNVSFSELGNAVCNSQNACQKKKNIEDI